MEESRLFVEELSNQNNEFAIIALTGKVKSGTPDICKLLTSFQFNDYATQPADTSTFSMSDIREQKLVYRYLHHNWKPFVELNVRSVILSFLLDDWDGKTDEYSIYNILEETLTSHIDAKVAKKIKKVHDIVTCKMEKRLAFGYKELEASCDKLMKSIGSVKLLCSKWKCIKEQLENQKNTIETFIFCYGVLPVLGDIVKSRLGSDVYTAVFQRFGNNIRAYGTAIVNSGNYELNFQMISASNLFNLPKRINYFIKILRHYRSLHKVENRENLGESEKSTGKSNPIFIVINNLKNIFEAFYFRRRYSAFYLLAVSCDERERVERFESIEQFKLAELRENLSSAKSIYKKSKKIVSKYGLNEIEKQKTKICEEYGLNDAEYMFLIEDCINSKFRVKCYENNIAPFILQDVMTCIENADIFLTRDYNEMDYKCDYPLIRSLARIVTLILHPGLLTPTKIERCMQIAMTAKLNSGCLSRQVGAVVTDREYNILSIGWNDAPCGSESCIRRNMYDLLRKHDDKAYSFFELNNEQFRKYLETIEPILNENKESLRGLPLAFCFKSIYQDIIAERDQIYTRALHGEERALATCGNAQARNGYLFTTASPCELCAKKAKEANISKIYYIEQYPGISRSHIIESGERAHRAVYEFFVGAVGLAYIKLYAPLIPYKDELAASGYSPVDIHKKEVNP